MFWKKYLFHKKQEEKAILVNRLSLYSTNIGYGFVTEKNRKKISLLRIPELNAAFDEMYWYKGKELTNIEQDERGCYVESQKIVDYLRDIEGDDKSALQNERSIPLVFKMDVPRQGNYKVAVRLYAGFDMQDILVFSGRRHLSWRSGKITAGQSMECEFVVNVCDIIPRGKERVYSDTSIDLTIVSERPCIEKISIKEMKCPTIYIAGDSTVTDQGASYPYHPGTSYAGWGQMLSAYLKEKVAVSNHAHSGLTTESFQSEGHYAVMNQYMGMGDYLFIQFGHNDQKLSHLRAGQGYMENLIRYIRNSKNKGVFPILVTPLARNSWKGSDGSYNDLLKEYADICIEIGEQEQIPVVDLHKESKKLIKRLGLEKSKRFFYPGDFTHTNDYGGYIVAEFVAKEIVEVCKETDMLVYRRLSELVTAGLGEWQPPEQIELPKKPECYSAIEDPEDDSIFQEIVNPEELINRVGALDIVIRAVGFFPTNVYNDMFHDVIGHEWYAGTVECAFQNGILIPELCAKRLVYPMKRVTLIEFLIFTINGYKSRRTIPREEESIYDERIPQYAQSYVRAACALGIIAKDGSADLDQMVMRKHAIEIVRRLNYS